MFADASDGRLWGERRCEPVEYAERVPLATLRALRALRAPVRWLSITDLQQYWLENGDCREWYGIRFRAPVTTLSSIQSNPSNSITISQGVEGTEVGGQVLS